MRSGTDCGLFDGFSKTVQSARYVGKWEYGERGENVLWSGQVISASIA